MSLLYAIGAGVFGIFLTPTDTSAGEKILIPILFLIGGLILVGLHGLEKSVNSLHDKVHDLSSRFPEEPYNELDDKIEADMAIDRFIAKK